jgi:urocanate hydratase
MGIVRRADAGYEIALNVAKEKGGGNPVMES